MPEGPAQLRGAAARPPEPRLGQPVCSLQGRLHQREQHSALQDFHNGTRRVQGVQATRHSAAWRHPDMQKVDAAQRPAALSTQRVAVYGICINPVMSEAGRSCLACCCSWP